ncbi:4Fe-4S dicluster domain-containing protein [Chloroflexota bacterium]
MQLGFYFDQTRCNGCFTCIVACKDWNDVDAGPSSWRRVLTIEKGSYPDLFVTFLSTSCYHCIKPVCVSVCPVNAINKRKTDGVVLVNRELCLGKDNCQLCLEACPYHVPQFGIEPNAKMQKCHFCIDRLSQGKKPACVDACPMYALDVGPISELRKKYGSTTQAEGFQFFKELFPSVIFKPRTDTSNYTNVKINVSPKYNILQRPFS